MSKSKKEEWSAYFRTSMAVREARGLTQLEKHVLLVLALRIGKKKHTWASQSTLAEEGSMSRRTIQRNLQRLEDMGIVRVLARSRQNFPNKYTIDIQVLESLNHAQLRLLDASETGRCVRETRLGASGRRTKDTVKETLRFKDTKRRDKPSAVYGHESESSMMDRDIELKDPKSDVELHKPETNLEPQLSNGFHSI